MTDSERRGGPRLVFGLVLIFLGVVFTLDRLDLVRADDILRFWPAIFILIGMVRIIFPATRGSRFAGGIFVLVGSWLLLDELGWVHLEFEDWWPVILVLVGVRLAWQGIFGRGDSDVDAEDLATVNAVAVLGGSKRRSRSQDFRGGDMIAFMGGCEVDLSEARISNGPAVIDAFAMWGGVEIRVPREWHVVMKGIPLLGGYEDQTRGGRSDDGALLMERQQLIVKGFAIMGGVEVKN